MDLFFDNFKREEKVSMHIRRLFEQFGYKKIRANKFEEYSLYIENKNFIRTNSIITFMDLDGKLLALKPDVSLSIVKNTSAARSKTFEKLYYIENVYRLSKQNHEYKEINQMGLELIGSIDEYSTIEVLTLATKSLCAINRNFIIDISHMGFVSGLLDELILDQTVKLKILDYLRAKNTHDLKFALYQTSLSEQQIQNVLKLSNLYGDFEKTLIKAKEIVINQTMQDALDELNRLYSYLKSSEFISKIKLDFSIINDQNYYSGVIFQGYVEGLADVILTGGRYDNLMKKLQKDKGAIGFAICLDYLNGYYKDTKKYDFDILVTYDKIEDYMLFLEQIDKLRQNGEIVRIEPAVPDGLKYKKRFNYNGSELEEVEIDA